MEPSQSQVLYEPLLAAMPQLKEKLRQGVPTCNPAPYPGHEVPNSTVAIGLRAALHLDAVRSRYTGKERDAESGNDYFGARYYASSMGRFLSPDWSAQATPVPYATMSDPQSLNLYSYMRNNPLGGVDADGHCDLQCTINIALGVANGISRDGGVGPYLKNVGIGALKGLGQAAYSTGAILNAGFNGNPYSLAPALMNQPAAITPSNTTQAQAALVTSTTVTVAASLPAAPEVEAAEISAQIPEAGQEVFRVWGGESGPFGHSWTPMNPESVSNFRDAAGLPNVNTGTQMTTGTLTDATGVTSRSALPLDGNKGGAPEYLVPKPQEQIQIRSIKDNTDHPM